MGDGLISNGFREKLERDLDNLQSGLKRKNESNKPTTPRPPPQVESGVGRFLEFIGRAIDNVAKGLASTMNSIPRGGNSLFRY